MLDNATVTVGGSYSVNGHLIAANDPIQRHAGDRHRIGAIIGPASGDGSKAAARTPKTGDLAVANKQAHTYTYGLGALRPDLPEGMSFGSSAVPVGEGSRAQGGRAGRDGFVDAPHVDGGGDVLKIVALDASRTGSLRGGVGVHPHRQ